MHKLLWRFGLSAMFGLLACLFAGAGLAKEAPSAAQDPDLEKRVMVIADELRCLVCQNQTIADSHAPLAVDLKNQIREKLKAGASNESVMAFMVERYGDFVLYRPPVKATTMLLWFGPFVLLAGAFAFLFVVLGHRKQLQQGEVPLDPEQRARARQILESGAKIE